MQKIGSPVRYVPDDDHAEDPLAAIVTKVHDDGRICLVYWCPERKGWHEATNVPIFGESDGDTDECYFEPLD